MNGLVRRGPPLRVLAIGSSHQVDVRRANALRHRAHLAAAEVEAVDREDRRDLVAAAAEERLLRHVELGPVDVALDDVHAEHLGADVLDQRGARDRLQDVAAGRRRDDAALAHHEEGGAAALGHLAVAVEQDGLIVAVGLRLENRQPSVLVVGARLQTDRDGVVGGPRPRRHVALQPVALHDPRPLARVDVEPGLRGGVEPRRAHVGHHVHVDVLAQLVAGDDGAHRLEQVVVRVGHVDAHHLHRLAQSREVIGEAEAVHLAVALAQVRAQALEDVGGVEDRRAVDGQHRLLLGDQPAVHPDIEGRHVCSSDRAVMLLKRH